MASLPDFNPNSVRMDDGNWQNRALKQIVPGSIFKTVVAAAVLEEETVGHDDHFLCEGQYGKYGFSCWKEGGHGNVTISEAYAQSCNIAFARAVLSLPQGKVEEYAKKLGLQTRVGWHESPFFKTNSFYQFSGEESGQVFAASTPNNDEGVLIQTAIGQRDVQISPLQAANMVATIIDGGHKKQVRVVKDIRYKTGTAFYSFRSKALPGDNISRYTASKLREMMELVVSEGTGRELKDAEWKLAGKTGTAQIMVEAERRNNQWFVGYGPAQNPQYVVAVIAEQEKLSSKNKVVPLFKKVMNDLASNTN